MMDTTAVYKFIPKFWKFWLECKWKQKMFAATTRKNVLNKRILLEGSQNIFQPKYTNGK